MRAPLRPLAIACSLALLGSGAHAETITIGIGTQDTTTNTVSVGAVIRQQKLLDKYLPKTGKYAGVTYAFDWQNFTSGPPVTNGMMANKLQFGGMGDYPLVVNGNTFQANPDSKSRLIAVASYNMQGSGNGLVVNKDSSYFDLSDLKGKLVSVPFGSAAHGMVLKAMQDRGLPANYFQLVSQTPEVGATNLRENKIDAHADFVPFPELLPHRGYARKIFDGAETNLPTWHGLVVRTDFAAKYPEVVVAYLKAVIEANEWIKADPKRAAEKIAEWTGIDKEVVYVFLGPSGIMTLDPTIKAPLIDAAAEDVKVLQTLGRIKEFDVKAWVDDSYIRKAYAELGLDYDKQLASQENYEISGQDNFCQKAITEPREGGEIWIEGEGISPYSSTSCTLGAYRDLLKAGKKISKVYLFDTGRKIKIFADQAFFVSEPSGGKPSLEAFMLKKEAEAAAAKAGGKVMTFNDAVQSAIVGG